jgi:hypothetical protein
MYSCKKSQRKNDMTQILYDIKAKKNGVNFLWCFFYKITYAYLCHEIVKEDIKVCKIIKVGVFVMWKFIWTMCGLLRKWKHKNKMKECVFFLVCVPFSLRMSEWIGV